MNVLYSILPPIKLRVKGYPFSIKNASGMSGAGVGGGVSSQNIDFNKEEFLNT